jgi:hypothetical protein
LGHAGVGTPGLFELADQVFVARHLLISGPQFGKLNATGPMVSPTEPVSLPR